MSTLTRAEFDERLDRWRAGAATEADLADLEPYRARQAVLLASGLGSRLAPITVNTPKPLVDVCGTPIIDTIVKPLVDAGIESICVVTGYRAEQFELLRRRWPQVELVYNPLYDSTNNISSAVAAGDRFRNAYVFESDLYIKNPALITPYRYRSCYLGVPVEATDDWCFDTDADGRILDLHRGGTDCFHMFGVSYWTAEDGARLAEDLPVAFAEEANRQRFWDDVPCVLANDRYDVHVEPVTFDDIAEIDSLAELQAMDPRYVVNTPQR